ncbi:MAG: recombinase family protein, partial [Phycisphaerae bacterium]|nr:recombinase family protein [Phycisphaerae bacterium]
MNNINNFTAIAHGEATPHLLSFIHSSNFSDSKKTGAFYGRYSSNKQNPKSAEDQLPACIKSAKEEDVVIMDEYCFVDRAKSGATTAYRTQFKRMMDIATSGNSPFSIIYVESTSRFGRNLKEVLVHEGALTYHGITVVFVQQNLRTDDPNFRMFLAIYALIDESYTKQLAENTRRGIVARIHQGKSPGFRVYGFSQEQQMEATDTGSAQRSTGSIYKPQPDRLGIVKEIYNIRQSLGSSCSNIARELNQRNIKAPGSVPPPAGEFWRGNHVRTILRQPLYTGILVWGRKRSRRHPDTGVKQLIPSAKEDIVTKEFPECAVITVDQWEDVQKSFPGVKAMQGVRPKHLNDKSPNLLTGISLCGSCGKSLGLIYGGRYGQYACNVHLDTNGQACKNGFRSRKIWLEESITKILTHRYTDPSFLRTTGTRLRSALADYIKKTFIEPAKMNNKVRLDTLKEERASLLLLSQAGKLKESSAIVIGHLDLEINKLQSLLSSPMLLEAPDMDKILPNSSIETSYHNLVASLSNPKTSKKAASKLVEK